MRVILPLSLMAFIAFIGCHVETSQLSDLITDRTRIGASNHKPQIFFIDSERVYRGLCPRDRDCTRHAFDLENTPYVVLEDFINALHPNFLYRLHEMEVKAYQEVSGQIVVETLDEDIASDNENEFNWLEAIKAASSPEGHAVEDLRGFKENFKGIIKVVEDMVARGDPHNYRSDTSVPEGTAAIANRLDGAFRKAEEATGALCSNESRSDRYSTDYGGCFDQYEGKVWGRTIRIGASDLDFEFWSNKRQANEYCLQSQLGGRENWRLPTAAEMQVLSEHGRDFVEIDPRAAYIVADDHDWTDSVTNRSDLPDRRDRSTSSENIGNYSIYETTVTNETKRRIEGKLDFAVDTDYAYDFQSGEPVMRRYSRITLDETYYRSNYESYTISGVAHISGAGFGRVSNDFESSISRRVPYLSHFPDPRPSEVNQFPGWNHERIALICIADFGN